MAHSDGEWDVECCGGKGDEYGGSDGGVVAVLGDVGGSHEVWLLF